jgi:hypothetical protein
MRENVKAQASMISPNTAMATPPKVTFVGKMDYTVSLMQPPPNE